jgi:hypothetical protein
MRETIWDQPDFLDAFWMGVDNPDAKELAHPEEWTSSIQVDSDFHHLGYFHLLDV